MKDIRNLILCIADRLLKHDNQAIVVSPNVEKKNEAYNSTLRLLSTGMCDSDKNNTKIYFKNGSTIEFITSNKSEKIIRGHKSQTPLFLNEDLCLYDYQKNILEEVSKEFVEPK